MHPLSVPSQLGCLNCWTFNVHLNPVHIHEEEEEEEEDDFADDDFPFRMLIHELSQ